MTYVITEISQAKKNTERVNVYLNGAFWIGINKNDLISLRLVKGLEISVEQKLEIEGMAANNKVIESAIRYTQLRPRSIAEVRDYLIYRKSLSPEEAESVTTLLQDKGFLDDEKFAQWYTDYKISTGVNGINKIKAELLSKHVDTKIISNIIEKMNASEEFKDEQLLKIKEFAEKIVKTIKAKDAYDLKTKLIQRLMGRGFKYDEIRKALKLLNFPL